jgi:hypothetical protein
MNDHELLRLSAKAMGFDLEYRRGSDAFYYDDPDSGREQWYPLGDDGQVVRLAVKLRLEKWKRGHPLAGLKSRLKANSPCSF